MWAKNFQFYLGFEEAEEPEIKLPTLTGSWRKQESSRKTSTSASPIILKPFLTVDHNKLWKILKEMRAIDHLICLLRNLYAGQEATVRILHGTVDWFQTGRGVWWDCILSSCLLNLHAEDVRQSAGLMNHKLETRLPGEISTTSDMQTMPL